jgi:predicted RNase H-like nuclease (RuvC/YqgF family)
MKATKPVIILLAILCLALGTGLFMGYQRYQEDKKVGERQRTDLSNNWSSASAQLAEAQKVNITLGGTVTNLAEEVQTKSNEVATLTSKLAKTEADAKAAAQTAKAELDKRDAKITELETQRDDLTKRMTELNTSITGLEKQIDDTERKLRTSEGDRAFLIKELKRLQAEKTELERQFNNLALLREQVRKLRDDMSIAKRLEWIRRGLYGATEVKGAERLQKGFTEPSTQTNFNLNVELRQDGGVKVGGTNVTLPPQPAASMNVTVSTNAPAGSKPAPNAPAATNAPPPK